MNDRQFELINILLNDEEHFFSRSISRETGVLRKNDTQCFKKCCYFFYRAFSHPSRAQTWLRKSDTVKRPTVVFGLQRDGVDWNSLDGTAAKIIIMIAVPEKSAGVEHLKILQMLSRCLMDDKFRNDLLSVTTVEEACRLLDTMQ